MRAKTAVCGLVLLLVARAAGAAVPGGAVLGTVDPGAKAEKYAAVVLDSDTGVVLYERNADFPRYPASLTKMMTLYLTFDALKAGRIKLTDRLPVSEHAASRDPSRLGLSPGSTLMLEDAIQAMTTKSANDAACVVGEALAKGSEARFAEMMTAKAHDLGMKHSTFRNASGLPESGHVSSALDLAVLARALVRDFPEQYHFFSVPSFDFAGKRWPNQNRFLRTYPGADGLKTGYIDSSGHNLAASAVRGGKRLISVVLGGNTMRWTRDYASQLLDLAYAGIGPEFVMLASASSAPAQAAGAVADAATAPGAAVAAPVAAPAALAPTAAAKTTTAPAAATSAAAPPIPSASRSAATETLLAKDKTPQPQHDATTPTGAATAQTPQAPSAKDKTPQPQHDAAKPTGAATAQTPQASLAKVKTPQPQPQHDAAKPTDAATAQTPQAPSDAATPTNAATPNTSQPSNNTARQANAATPQTREAAAVPATTWSVQIGLYRDRALAEKRGMEARERVPGSLGKAPMMLAGYGSNVSPRFDGLSESDARQACAQLQRASLPCVVVPPGRALIIATN